MAVSNYSGGIELGQYFVDEVIGKGNIEIMAAFAPVIPLAILGLMKLTAPDKKRIIALSPLVLPVLPVLVWNYFESRLFLIVYPLLFLMF